MISGEVDARSQYLGQWSMSTASVEVEEEDEDKGCLIGVDIEYLGRYRPLFFAPESSMSTPGDGLTLGGGRFRLAWSISTASAEASFLLRRSFCLET